MSARILDGRAIASQVLEELKPKVKKLDPKLVIVQVGDDPASASYIKQKLKSCEEVGMRHEHRHLPADTPLETLFAAIRNLNADTDVTGFIVQMPLPGSLGEHSTGVALAIHPDKDVDGFGAYNIGNTFLGRSLEYLSPATPAGILMLLERSRIAVAGKHAVIVGRSNTVGKPLAVMLLNRDATVTVCHSKTPDLAAVTRLGDILICAVGSPKLIKKDMVKLGAVVIDVGVNRIAGALIGDVDFDTVKEVASAITPVPGGVGPMTVAALIRNCVRAKERQLAMTRE